MANIQIFYNILIALPLLPVVITLDKDSSILLAASAFRLVFSAIIFSCCNWACAVMLMVGNRLLPMLSSKFRLTLTSCRMAFR